MVDYKNITFIGAGNMARAIIQGMLSSGYPEHDITVTNHSCEKLDFFTELNVHTTQDNVAAVKESEVVVLAIKPHQVRGVCEQIAPGLKSGTLVLSIAASITTECVSHALGTKHAVVRAMPNIGSAVCAGVTGVFAGSHVTPAQEAFVEAIFSAIGLVVWLEDEGVMSAVTAVSGSGIAYFLRIMEIIEAQALNLGLPQEVVKFMIAQTALGAAKLSLESEDDFATLREAVVSPGGTTQQALQAMDAAGLEAAIQDGMRAVLNRSKDMTEELCKP